MYVCFPPPSHRHPRGETAQMQHAWPATWRCYARDPFRSSLNNLERALERQKIDDRGQMKENATTKKAVSKAKQLFAGS